MLPIDDGIAAVWDGELVSEMRRHGHAIDEEAVAEQLLADLQSAGAAD